MEVLERIFEIWAIVGRVVAILLGAFLLFLPFWKKKFFTKFFFALFIIVGITLMMPAINLFWKFCSILLTLLR